VSLKTTDACCLVGEATAPPPVDLCQTQLFFNNQWSFTVLQARRSRHWKFRKTSPSTKFQFTCPGEKNAEWTCAALRNCSKGNASGLVLRSDKFSSKHTESFHVERKHKTQRAKKQRNHRRESHVLHAYREHGRLSVTRPDFQVSIIRSVGSVGALTFVCKLLGLLREVMIAAKFGVGLVRALTLSSHFHAIILTRQLESPSL
jgi:hypothetical protein